MKRKFIYSFLSLIIISMILVVPTTFAVNEVDAQAANPNAASNADAASSNDSLNAEDTEDDSSSNSGSNMYGNILAEQTPLSNALPSSGSVEESSAKISTTTDEFGLNSILNLILLVVGILLVLLAIAILIRLGGK